MTEDLAVSAGEVRATARFPHRSSLAVWAIVAAGFGLALCFVAQGPLPGRSQAPDPTAALCQVDPSPRRCLESLPPTLRGLPEPSQYERWRRWDLAQQLELPTDAPLPAQARWLEQRAGQTEREGVVSALQGMDAWADWGLTPLRPELEERVAWMALAAERDWSQPVPTLPTLPTEAELEARYAGADLLVAHEVLERHQELRRLATEVLAEYQALYARQRLRLIQKRWEREEIEELKAQLDQLKIERSQAASRGMFQALAAACLAFSALLGAAWVWLRPIAVVVGIHHLQLGRHKLPWTEIQRISWGGGEAEALTANHFYTLWPRVVPREAREALASASQQALARTRTLRPLDDAALEEVRQLGRAREKIGRR